tara:strand:- start:1044 stop:1874 length:831 start_codon:yes stop_codon:yes gene_type:complete
MIYIIVPTFDRVEDTKNFLNSIHRSVSSKYLVLLIDDHPSNITFNTIKKNNVKVLPSNEELWWVGSVNLGIKKLLNEYNLKEDDIVVFANNDVQIEKKSFEILVNEIKKDNYQIIHPRTFDLNQIEVSSGTKIISLFPYVTKHPKNFKRKKVAIDMGTTRFLMMGGGVLKKVGYINQELLQYGGDNDFTLTAKRSHNIKTYIMRDAVCVLDDSQTGIKNQNIPSYKELFKSFNSIKSPNNIRFRYILFKKHYGKVASSLITLSLTINTIIKFIIKR